MQLKDIAIARLAQLGVGPVEAATAAGIERTFIRDLVEGKKKSIRSDKIADLARALKLNADALRRHELQPEDGPSPIRRPEPMQVPLLATVSAGELMRDDIGEEALGTLWATDLPPGDWIALRVNGTSMDRISPPDSVIFVNRRDKALVANACYVIADEDGHATYKRFRPSPDRFEPVSTNDHPTIYPDQQPVIVGRVRRSWIDM